MKKIYDKNESNFALIWIAIYVILASVCDSISGTIGSAKKYLHFIPLVIIASINLFCGVQLNLTVIESVLYVVSMLCVGFLEEVIFRGFLFTIIFYKGISLWPCIITHGVLNSLGVFSKADSRKCP